MSKRKISNHFGRGARKVAILGLFVFGVGTYMRINAEQRDCNLEEYWWCAVDECAGPPDACTVGSSGTVYCIC